MIREKILNRQLSYGGTKINMLVVLMSVLLMTSLSQNPQPIDTNIQRIETNIQPRDTNIQPIEISLQYGHNSYSQLSRYFRSNEQYTISDMKSEVDLKSYHFCYIQTSTYNQVEIQHTLSLSSNEGSPSSKDNTQNGVNNNGANHKDNNSVYKDGNININIDRSQQQQQQQQEKIVYDLDDIISTENVLATQFYHSQRQTTSTSSTTQYTQSQSSSLLIIVMPTKYITLKLQQQRLTQSQSQQQTHQVKQKRYKVSSKLSTSFSNTIAIAKFIKINNINHNEQGSNINNINHNSNKQEYVLMTDTQLFKVQIDKSRIRQQNYYGSIYINGKLNNIQQNTIKRNLQQHQQQQINQIQNNQTETHRVNQQQKQQKQQQQQQQQKQQQQQQQQQIQETNFQVQQQQQQNLQQRQQEQHFSSGVSVSNKEILLYSNKNIYLYDLMTGKLNTINKVNQSTDKTDNNNNKLYTQLIGNKNIELSIIEYTNNSKDKLNKNNDNDSQQQQTLVLIVADRDNDIKLRYYNNQTQLLNSFSQQTNTNQSSITTTQQSKDYTQQYSLNQQQLYSLPNSHKCRHINQYNNKYIFVQCKNHLIYYSLQQIINCKPNKTLQLNNTILFDNKTQTCINSIKAKHLNLGYHIQSIYLNEQTNYITVTGIDKYQTFHIDYNSQQNQINSIYPINTYYFNQQNIKQVYLIDYNNSLILTKTNLYILKQLPQTKQIYCKTIDQHSHKGLSQPTGVFNGNITVQGVCQDNLININNNIQYQRVQNSTYCRYTVPVTVNITYVVKTYEFLWYILLGLGIFLSTIGFLYCLIKRQKLNQIYKTLEEENQHGQQVVQHTVITENNESQQQSLPIDVPK